jgi:hypothetical protein
MTMASRAGWRPLAVLTAAVLALHLLALRAVPGVFDLRDPLRAHRLITHTVRTVPAPVVAAPAAPAVPAPALPAPVQRAQQKQKQAVARTESAPPAINSIAIRSDDTAPTPPAEPPPLAAAPPAIAESPAPDAAAITRETRQPSAFSIPGSVRLRYAVAGHSRAMPWQAKAELLWRHDGSDYEARLEASIPFLPARVQRSTGRITAEGLAPTRFSDKARSEEAAHFERDKGKVSFSTNRPDAPLLAGAQDRLSVLLQLGAMIGGEPSPPSTTISVQTASTREADVWLFTVEGEEELQLPGGPVRALKLIRNPRKEFDQKVELWLAPGMDYVPVRLRLTQANGDWLDQQWLGTDKG